MVFEQDKGIPGNKDKVFLVQIGKLAQAGRRRSQGQSVVALEGSAPPGAWCDVALDKIYHLRAVAFPG